MASPPWIPLVLSFLAIITACNARPLFDDDVGKIMTTQPLLPSVISCSTAGNYSDGSQYHVNLDRLLSGIPMAAAKDGGFFNGTFGTAGDKVFALFMCYAGDTDSECQDCLTRAPAGVMKLCPRSQTVRAVYNACTLRYSDESFFSIADFVDIADLSDAPRMEVERSSYITQYGRDGDNYANWYEGVVPLVGYVVDTTGMSHMRFLLIRRLMVMAGQVAERIAEGTQRFADTQWVWAVAQCTRDLPASECTRCLSYYTDQLPRLLPNNSGGAIKGYSCYLGYAILADKPSTVRLNRYRYSENYARKMAVQELEHQREMADEESRRRTRRRNIVIIVSLVTIAVVLCLLVLSLWYRWRRWVAAVR